MSKTGYIPCALGSVPQGAFGGSTYTRMRGRPEYLFAKKSLQPSLPDYPASQVTDLGASLLNPTPRTLLYQKNILIHVIKFFLVARLVVVARERPECKLYHRPPIPGWLATRKCGRINVGLHNPWSRYFTQSIEQGRNLGQPEW